MKPGELGQVLEIIRNEIQAEHSLISHRMGWYTTAQSFLVTAFAIAWSVGHESSFKDFFGYAIPVAGGLLSLAALGAIIAAIIVQWHLIHEQTTLIEIHEEELKVEHDAEWLAVYKKITCSGRSSGYWLHGLALIPVVFIPTMFFVLWCWAFYAGRHVMK